MPGVRKAQRVAVFLLEKNISRQEFPSLTPASSIICRPPGHMGTPLLRVLVEPPVWGWGGECRAARMLRELQDGNYRER